MFMLQAVRVRRLLQATRMWFGRDQVKRVTDSVMAMGSSEVGRVGEESNVTNPDE